eukprot:5673788-Pleurochrysis_carterae.AAC.1
MKSSYFTVGRTGLHISQIVCGEGSLLLVADTHNGCKSEIGQYTSFHVSSIPTQSSPRNRASSLPPH